MTFLCPSRKPVWSPNGPAHVSQPWAPTSRCPAAPQVQGQGWWCCDTAMSSRCLCSDGQPLLWSKRLSHQGPPLWPLLLTSPPQMPGWGRRGLPGKPWARASLFQQSRLSENTLCSASWHEVCVTTRSTGILTTLFPISRSVLRTCEANACTQETGLRVRELMDLPTRGPETRILVFSESRPHTFWKKSNSQEMGKADHVYETSLQLMPHIRVWVLISVQKLTILSSVFIGKLAQPLLVWLLGFMVIVLESFKPVSF